jgi:hypothetical protein
MSFITQKLKPFVFATTLLSLTTLAACSPPWASKPIDFEFTGQVLDKDSNEPIEGAYALAVYRKVDIGFGGTADYCYKTKGMLTGKDGKFHFTMERPTSLNPDMVYAIKPDYFSIDWVIPTPALQDARTKETYTNRHVYLKKQDTAKPSFQHGFIDCARPESSEAIEAAEQFMRIEVGEQIKYGRDGINRTNMIKSMRETASKQIYKN